MLSNPADLAEIQRSPSLSQGNPEQIKETKTSCNVNWINWAIVQFSLVFKLDKS